MFYNMYNKEEERELDIYIYYVLCSSYRYLL